MEEENSSSDEDYATAESTSNHSCSISENDEDSFQDAENSEKNENVNPNVSNESTTDNFASVDKSNIENEIGNSLVSTDDMCLRSLPSSEHSSNDGNKKQNVADKSNNLNVPAKVNKEIIITQYC